MDRAGCLRGNVTRDAAREGELLEETLQSRFVLADVWVQLAVRAFEIGVGNQRRPTVPRSRDVDHVEVVLLDEAIEMDVHEVLAGCGSPMAQESRLDVLGFQRLAQKGVLVKIDLTDRPIVRRPP